MVRSNMSAVLSQAWMRTRPHASFLQIMIFSALTTSCASLGLTYDDSAETASMERLVEKFDEHQISSADFLSACHLHCTALSIGHKQNCEFTASMTDAIYHLTPSQSGSRSSCVKQYEDERSTCRQICEQDVEFQKPLGTP
jgi:hypothetical protein